MSNCIVCNSVIEGNRRGKKYCSSACKQKAYYNRKHGNGVITTVTDAPLRYNFDQFKRIKNQTQDKLYFTYIEYCFIRSCNPSLTDDNDIIQLIYEVFEDAFDRDTESEARFNSNLNLFRDRFYSVKVGEGS